MRPHPMPRCATRSRPRFDSGAAIALACALAALAGAPRFAHAAGEPDAPRLILPGGHEVRAGELIQLRWTATDSVAELEILLSRDGGRTYPACISPRLDPHRPGLAWRVPASAGGTLRMRVRFNRGGREIEGAPTAALRVLGDDPRAEPLGLPPLAAGAGAREPAPASGRGSASASVVASLVPAPRPSHAPGPSTRRPAAPSATLFLRPASASDRAAFAAPRLLPLRA